MSNSRTRTAAPSRPPRGTARSRRHRAGCVEVVRAGTTPTTSATCGASANASAPAAAGVEHRLGLRGTARAAGGPLREVGRPLLLQRLPELAGHVAASVDARDRASASASSRVAIVLAARSSSMTARIRRDLGPGCRPSSSPADERPGVVREACGLDDRRGFSEAPTNASASSAHGSVLRKRWIERGRVIGPAGAQEHDAYRQLVRDGQAAEVLAQGDDEPEVGIVDRVEPVVEGAAELGEEPDLVETPVPGRGRDGGARQDPLSGRTGHERRGPRRSAPSRRPCANRASSSRRTARSSRSGSSSKIEGETAARHRPEIRLSPVRVAALAAVDGDGDRVEGVPRREVVLDPVRQRREVDRALVAVDHDAPRPVALRERERNPAEAARVAMCGVPRLATGDVEVEHRPPEELVPDRTADDPRPSPARTSRTRSSIARTNR